MADGILKEFLVSIGFEVNEQQYRRFTDLLDRATESLRNLAVEGAAAAFVLAEAVNGITDKMDQLYFSSRRTGASAQNLTAFGQAATQVGVSAEAANGALENMAHILRTRPGTGGLLGMMGIDARGDKVQVAFQLLDRLKQLSDKGAYYQAAQYGAMFGIDERTLFQMINNLGSLKSSYTKAQKEMRDSHVDMNKEAREGNALATKQRDIMFQISNVKMRAWEDALPVANRLLDLTEKIFKWWDKLDPSTQKWVAGITAAGIALGSVSLALTAISTALSLVGLGGGGAVAGGAAVAGGTGAIASIVASVLGAGVVIAAIGGIYELWKHNEAVTKFGANLVKGVPSFLGNDNKVFDGSLSDVLKHFEGVVKGAYTDIGGKVTSGVGHLVRPGEKAPTTDAEVMAQFSQDMAATVQEVKRTVKAHLTSGQEKALEDFVYNIGNKAFEQSIVPLVNSGNMSAVASKIMEFDKYHDKQGRLVESDVLRKRRTAEAAQFAPTISQKTDIHVNGAGADPRLVAQIVVREQRKTNADMVRNMGGVAR